MGADLFRLMIELTAATSAALLVVALLRKPLRNSAGAQIAYWLWLVVPASALAVIVPAPMKPASVVVAAPLRHTVAQPIIHAAPVMTSRAVAPAAKVRAPAAPGIDYTWLALLAWAAGVFVMLVRLTNRQRLFVRSLGRITSDTTDTYRSDSIAGPMVMGLWRPRVVLPMDFESRYSQEERAVVLEHEHAHRQRGDLLANALAAAWLCLFWFNPLMYWAIGRFRFDQELACDALVLARAGFGRKRYATALLKTQLANDSAWRLPVSCHWQSNHPLTERIAMLKQPLPTLKRRIVGTTCTLAFIASGGYAAWAAQPADVRQFTKRVSEATARIHLAAAGEEEVVVEVATVPAEEVVLETAVAVDEAAAQAAAEQQQAEALVLEQQQAAEAEQAALAQQAEQAAQEAAMQEAALVEAHNQEALQVAAVSDSQPEANAQIVEMLNVFNARLQSAEENMAQTTNALQELKSSTQASKAAEIQVLTSVLEQLTSEAEKIRQLIEAKMADQQAQ